MDNSPGDELGREVIQTTQSVFVQKIQTLKRNSQLQPDLHRLINRRPFIRHAGEAAIYDGLHGMFSSTASIVADCFTVSSTAR